VLGAGAAGLGVGLNALRGLGGGWCPADHSIAQVL